MLRRAIFVAAVGLWVAWPAAASGQDEPWREVRQAILDSYEYSRANLADRPDAVASEGSLEFWSSGGLLQRIAPDTPPAAYETFGLYPKHIWVTMLADDIAVAHFYAEGPVQTKDGPMVSNYRTRAMQVFVKEEGEWKVRAAHWSPVMGGSGTAATAVQN